MNITLFNMDGWVVDVPETQDYVDVSNGGKKLAYENISAMKISTKNMVAVNFIAPKGGSGEQMSLLPPHQEACLDCVRKIEAFISQDTPDNWLKLSAAVKECREKYKISISMEGFRKLQSTGSKKAVAIEKASPLKSMNITVFDMEGWILDTPPVTYADGNVNGMINDFAYENISAIEISSENVVPVKFIAQKTDKGEHMMLSGDQQKACLDCFQKIETFTSKKTINNWYKLSTAVSECTENFKISIEGFKMPQKPEEN